MSKIEKLVKEKCPNGVEYKKLKEIGEIFTGLSGKSKKDFENGNSRYITYTNIYNNPEVILNKEDFVFVTENENQNYIIKGDILVTGSSESMEDSGMISVVTQNPSEKIYLNSFCFGLRLNQKYKNKILPGYSKHIFRSEYFREQILTCSFGVTRYNLNKNMFLELNIPIPPIEIQESIVRILDKFGDLEAELEAELEARKKQYEFWREKLLKTNYDVKKLKDVANIYDSLHATPKYVDVGYPMIRVADVKFGYVNTENALKVDKETFEKFIGKYKPKKEDIIISRVGSYGNLCVVGDEEICLGQNTSIINPKINKKYLYYFLSGTHVQEWIKSNVKGAGYKSLSLANINEIPVIVPPLEVQEKIVNILDKFEKLINDKSEGILAEIELRKKQYDYYRNKLLSFKEVIN